MITVMGATGQVGGAIARTLLDAGEDVRALGRSEAKLAELEATGARTLAGDAAHAGYLRDAFEGADAVFTLLPYDPFAPDYHAQQTQVGEAIAAALATSGVRHVVALSSVGADLPAGTGFIASLHAQEQRLRRLEGVDVLCLRPGAFFENAHAALELIDAQGINGDAVAPDVALPMIAVRDVAAAAAHALAARDWEGFVVRELLGQRDLSYGEMTRIIGEQVGRPDLPYVQFTYADMAQALVQMGFSRGRRPPARRDGAGVQCRHHPLARGPHGAEHDADLLRGVRRAARRRRRRAVRRLVGLSLDPPQLAANPWAGPPRRSQPYCVVWATTALDPASLRSAPPPSARVANIARQFSPGAECGVFPRSVRWGLPVGLSRR